MKKNRPYSLYELPQLNYLHQLFKENAERNPEKIVFSYTEKNAVQPITYRQAWQDVRALHAFLRSEIGTNRHIAIVGENSYEWLVSFLAITGSGNVAVPIDKDCTPEQLAALMQQADCAAAFVASKCMHAIEEACTFPCNIALLPLVQQRTYIEQGKVLLKKHPDWEIPDSDQGDKLAALFFTSGTTGPNKAVMLSHRNIVSNINGACQNFFIPGTDIAILPFHHSFGLMTVFMQLNWGQTAHICPSSKKFLTDLQKVQPEMLFVVPQYLQIFYKRIWAEAEKAGKKKLLERLIKLSNVLCAAGVDLRRLLFRSVLKNFGGKLKYIIAGGSALEPVYCSFFRSIGVGVFNGYGITEASPVVSVNRNHYWVDESVGVPLPVTEVSIADDGEIVLAGPCIALGYYKDDSATQAVFRNDRFYTGDLGRLGEDGFLYITGRKKNLIILSNGENICPEQIEELLLRDDAICEVIVYAERDHLIAEVFPEEGFDRAAVDTRIRQYNSNVPLCRQIAELRIREQEFKKTSSMKIVREHMGDL